MDREFDSNVRWEWEWELLYRNVNRKPFLETFFMKLFRSSTTEIVHYCQTVLGCELPSVIGNKI